MTQKLRADQQRTAERVERSNDRPLPAPAPAIAHAQEAIENAAKAAVAAAVLPITSVEDVTIRPIQPKPSLFPEPASLEPKGFEPPAPGAFIPPAPERAANRRPRMPRIDELPLPAQNQLRVQHGEAPTPAPEHPEKRRMSLLQRLASVGLGPPRGGSR